MTLTDKEQYVWDWAQEIHKDQARKYTGVPYSTHLWEVAEIADEYLDGILHVPIALLHDSLEDQPVSEVDIMTMLAEAGYSISARQSILIGVLELTDVYTHENYPHLNRGKRKEMEAERMSSISQLAQSIKYADFISNISSIAKYDPDFAKVYVEEKIRILDKMRQGNIHLLIGACSALVDAQRQIHGLQVNL